MHVPPPDQKTCVVAVDLSKTTSASFMGLGIQVDPFRYEPTEAQWKTTWDRVSHCKPGFFRVCFQADAYCAGFADSGEPVFKWKRTPIDGELKKVFRLLDYAEEHGVDVMIGEWGCPRLSDRGKEAWIQPEDPRWADIITSWLRYLLDEKGYTCIKDYDFFNEPNGDWSGMQSYESWVAGMGNLAKAFERKGLKGRVRISGPSSMGNSNWLEGFDWLDQSVRDLPGVEDSYNVHWYAEDDEVLDGSVERVLRDRRRRILDLDPKAAQRPFFMGESGIFTGRTNGDQQPRVKTFEYGVLMADYVAQVARAGWLGATYWDLDDAMHPVGPDTDPPGPLTLKVWGFWNTQGTRMGDPDDERMRPPFYVWTLGSRLFPRGTRMVESDTRSVDRLRSLAGVPPEKGAFSAMVVNDSDAHRKVLLKAVGCGRKALHVYRYFADDRPVDRDGFPVAAAELPDADLDRGIDIDMPSRGCVFVTTTKL
jgi:hypothetical protein